MDEFMGSCAYCGQINSIERYESQEEANAEATARCNCPEASIERRQRNQENAGRYIVRELFGAGAEKYGYDPVPEDSVKELADMCRPVARDDIGALTVQIPGYCTAKIGKKANGKIYVRRIEKNEKEIEG